MRKTPPPPSTPTTLHVGLDVAKLTLQVDLAGKDLALANTPAGYKSLLTHLCRLQTKTGRSTHVVCEGTGGYERAVVVSLQAADQRVSVHNAARVRAFARAQGRLAKTRCPGCRRAQRLRSGHAARERHAAQRGRSSPGGAGCPP